VTSAEAGADIAQLREDGELGGRASGGAWRQDAEPDLLADEAILVQIVSWGNQLLRIASVGDAAPICRVLLGGDDRSGKVLLLMLAYTMFVAFIWKNKI
jgi:hypothetical protein